MTFAALRQTVLQAGALSTSFFAEVVEFTAATGEISEITVKITHEQLNPKPARSRDGNNVDELERILVLVSRDSEYAGGAMITKPNPGEQLRRSEARDADRRPFAFAGEVSFEGDQHAVYVFQRPRRYVQGRNR